jgi:hypothetical protein
MKKLQPKMKKALIGLLVAGAVASGFLAPQYISVLTELLNQIPV